MGPSLQAVAQDFKGQVVKARYDAVGRMLIFDMQHQAAAEKWGSRLIPFRGRILQLRPLGEEGADPAIAPAGRQYTIAAHNPNGIITAVELLQLFADVLGLTVHDVDRWGPDGDGIADPDKWRIVLVSHGCPPALQGKTRIL